MTPARGGGGEPATRSDGWSLRNALERTPLTTAVVYTVVGVLPLYLVSAQAVTVQRDLGFGPTQLGLIVSSYFLVSSVAAKRVGPRLDRTGGRRGLRLATSLTAAACAAIVVGAHRWEALAVLLGVAGLANAYGQVGSNLVIAHLVGAGRQGVAFSVKQAAIPAAALLAGFSVPVLGASTSWRLPYVGVLAIALVLFLACPAVVTPQVPSKGRQEDRRRVTPALVALMTAGTVGGGTGNTVASFTADAAAASGFGVSVAALLLTAGSATAIVVRLAAGRSVDRGGGTGMMQMAVLFSLGAIGLAVLSQATGSRPWFVVGLLLTFAGAWGWQGIVSYLVLRTVDLPAATSTGAVWSGIYFGTVVVPALVGVVADRASYTIVFAGMSAAMLLALGALLLSGSLGRHGS